MLSSTATEIQNKYNAGQRDFPNLQLRREDLHGLSLKNANLQGADFSYANLRNADLSGADLRNAYFNEADLTGANLENANLANASLVKTYLIKVNLQGANLQEAYLSGAYLTKGNLENALLQGAYFNGTQLTGAKLTNGKYNQKTKFDHTVNLSKLGLVSEEQAQPKTSSQVVEKSSVVSSNIDKEVRIDELVKMLNHLLETGQRYLGPTMTTRYWKSAKPDTDWVNQFELDSASKIIYTGTQDTPLSGEQLEEARRWIIAFVKSCSMIIQNYTEMLDPEKLAFPIVGKNGVKKTANLRSVPSAQPIAV